MRTKAEMEALDRRVLEMPWEDVCHFIAQGAINICEDINTIEYGSLVHVAMLAFCNQVELKTKGNV